MANFNRRRNYDSGPKEFEETVDSMQIEHENIQSAKKGDEIAIKISGKTKEGAVVYKVE